MLSVRRWRRLSSSSLPPPSRPAQRTALMAVTSSPRSLHRIAAPRCSAASTPSARRAVCPWSARADSSRARRRATPTTWSCGASSTTSRPAARRSAIASRRPATSRAVTTGSSARRSPGPSNRSTRPTASCARGWPAPGTARSSSIRASATSGIGITPGLTDGSANPGATAVLDFGFRTASPTLPRWRSATACARTAGRSRQAPRSVRIDLDALEALDPGDPPQLDPQRHYLEGPAADVADYLLVLDAINFGSGWFPTLSKRAGCSGYFTVAWSLADRWRAGAGVDRGAAARDALRRGGRDARPEPRPRAHGTLRPGPARARPLPRRAPRARRRRPGGRIGAAVRRAAGRGHDDVAGRRLLQARADRRQRPRAGRRGASSTTSTR